LKGIGNLLTAAIRPLAAPGLWVTLALLTLLIYAGTGYARELRPVTLSVDGTSQQIYTQRAIVGELLADVGLELREQDRVMPGQDASIKDGMTIVVQCARPVTIVADGVTRTLYTHSQNVEQILSKVDLALEPQDILRINGEPVLDTSSGTPPDTSPLRTASNRSRPRSPSSAISHIEIERATSLHLHDNGVEQTLYTTADTVGQTLLDAGTVLYLADHVHPGLSTPVSGGMHIYIRRSKPVQIEADGQIIRTRTHAETIEQVLAESGISLVGLDFVTPPAETQVADETHIRVTRVTEKIIIEQDEIPFETQWLPDASLELDQKRVDHVGENGINRRRYKAIFYDGQQVKTYLEDEWIAQEPRPRQIAYGTKIVIRTLETPEGTVEYWRRLRVFLTSYTEATCGKTPDHPWYGKTRIGWQMRHGIIAVDPLVIPMLTEMYVTGYGPGIAADTGGMIKGMHIDLGHEVDDFVMYYWWGYTYLLTPVPPANQIRWILPDFPRER
jgi:uncharacterized protein YabE (DUF348 family)